MGVNNIIQRRDISADRAVVVGKDGNYYLAVIPFDEVGAAGGYGSRITSTSVYSNAFDDFTATPTVGDKTITIGQLPYTLEVKHVVGGGMIKRISSDGMVTSLSLAEVTVSGDVITLPQNDDFRTGDSVVVFLAGPDKVQSTQVYDEYNGVVKFQGNDGASITPSDSNTFSPGFLYVGTGGTLVVQTVKGTQLSFYNVPNGYFMPVMCNMVYATGTTCADILVLY